MHRPTTLAPPRATARSWRARIGRIMIALGIAAVVCGGTFGVQRAGAILHEVQETGLPGYLSLRSSPADPYWKDLSPGDTVHWIIEASLNNAPSSTLALEMRSSGPLADTGRLQVSVESCRTAFETSGAAPLCSTDGQVVVPDQLLSQISSASDGTVFPLATLTHLEPRHLLVSLTVTAPPNAPHEDVTRIGVGLTATGSDLSAGSGSSPAEAEPPVLAATGADASILAVLAVGILLIAGGTMTLRRALPSGGSV